MKRILLVLLCTIQFSCLNSEKEDTSSSLSEAQESSLDVEFADQLKVSQENGNSSLSQNTNVGGLFFGSLDIVAYNYRPNEQIQRSEPENGYVDNNWSVWTLLGPQDDNCVENVLRPGESLKLAESISIKKSDSDKEFIKNVGVFSVDFFELAVYLPGIIYNNEFHYHGDNIIHSDPLYKYPEWSSIPRFGSHPGIGGFSGFPGHGQASDVTERINEFSVLFARDDWFTEPVLVYFEDRTNLTASSIPLSSLQENLLKDIIAINKRRNITHLIVVPYSRKAILLNKNGNGKLSAKATIAFNLNDLIETGSIFSGAESVIKFKRDSKNVPFGITLKFKDKN